MRSRYHVLGMPGCQKSPVIARRTPNQRSTLNTTAFCRDSATLAAELLASAFRCRRRQRLHAVRLCSHPGASQHQIRRAEITVQCPRNLSSTHISPTTPCAMRDAGGMNALGHSSPIPSPRRGRECPRLPPVMIYDNGRVSLASRAALVCRTKALKHLAVWDSPAAAPVARSPCTTNGLRSTTGTPRRPAQRQHPSRRRRPSVRS